MAEIINLRRARKAKARQAATIEAAANRAVHGRGRVQRSVEEKERSRQEAVLNGAALDRTEPEG